MAPSKNPIKTKRWRSQFGVEGPCVVDGEGGLGGKGKGWEEREEGEAQKEENKGVQRKGWVRRA